MNHFSQNPAKQMNDDVQYYIHRLCSELDKYKAQNQTLRQQMAQSRSHILQKDQLLNDRSQCILRCRAENWRLKQQIKILESNQSSRSKGKTSRKRKKPKEALVTLEIPYMVSSPSASKSNTALSTCAEACKISLPSVSRQRSVPSHIKILEPIHESPCDSYNSFRSNDSGSKCNVKISDDNHNIVHDEWQHCFAFIDSIPPKTVPQNSRRFSSESVGRIMSDDDEDEEFSSCCNSSTEYISDNIQSEESVSYMSDNTDLWMDIHDDSPIVDVSEESTLSQPHFPKVTPERYTEASFDQTSGCDMVVVSPVIDFMQPKASYV